MTPIGLMEALAARLQILLDGYTSEQPTGIMPIKVNAGYFPIPENAREKNSAIHVLATKETDDKDMSTISLQIGLSIYDDNTVDGWRTMYNVAEHIRQDLLKHRYVDMRYRLELPLSFEVVEDQPFPQWQGIISATYTVPQPVEEEFNDF